MKQVFRFNNEGYYIEPVVLEFPDSEGNYKIPDDCTEVELPQPNWKPKWTGEVWEETITLAELDEIRIEEKEKEQEEVELHEQVMLLTERVRALEGEKDD